MNPNRLNDIPENGPSQERFALPEDALTDELWRNVAGIYFKHANPGYTPTEDDFSMIPVDEVYPGSQFRLGSRFSNNSKLEVTSVLDDDIGRKSVQFKFYINDSVPKYLADEAVTAVEEFEKDIDDYLRSTGSAISISE